MRRELKGNVTLTQYKAYKVRILKSLGHQNVTSETFSGAKTEIAVDNIARRIIMS